MKNIKCQKAHSGIVSSRQGLGKPGLWLVTYTKNAEQPLGFSAFSPSFLVNSYDFFFIVAAACLTYSVRHHKFSALRALHQIRSAHLPVSSSLISSSF